MRDATTLLGALSALVIAPSATPIATEAHNLEFRPAAGAAVERSLTTAVEVTGGALEVWMDGEPIPPGFLPEIEVETVNRISVEVVDRFTRGEDQGRSLLRRFRAATHAGSGSIDGQGTDEETWDYSADSALAGEFVHFEWADGDASPTATLVDGDSLAPIGRALPPGLVEDLDLRGLLPADGVEIGASWTATGAALAGLIDPCGELDFQLEGEAARYLPPVEERAYGGELELTLTAVDDGLARIAVEGKVERSIVLEGDLSQVPVASGAATDTVLDNIEVEGELVWAVEAGLLHSLTLEGRVEREHWTRKDEDQPGPPFESRMDFAGELQIEMSVDVL